MTTTRAEEDAAILLVIDAVADHGRSGGVDGAASSLDLTVRAAAALAENAVRRGDRVALRVVGGSGRQLPFGSGWVHLRRLLLALSAIQSGGEGHRALASHARVPLRATEGTTVVLLTPMLTEAIATVAASTARRGLPTLVIDTLPPDAEPALPDDTDPDLADLAWRMRKVEREQVLAGLSGARLPGRRLARAGHPRRRAAPAGPARPAAPGADPMTRVRRGRCRSWLARLLMLLGPLVGSGRGRGRRRSRRPAGSRLWSSCSRSVGRSCRSRCSGRCASRWCSPGGGWPTSAGCRPRRWSRPSDSWSRTSPRVVTAYGPPEMAVDAPTVRLWVTRGAAVFGAAPIVWMLAVLVRDQPEPPGVWIAAMVAVVVAAVLATAWRSRRPRSASVAAEQEEYVERVLEYVERVPRGRVTTYGAIADVVGGGPRQVGSGDVPARRPGAVVAGGPGRRLAAAEPRGRGPPVLPRGGHAAAAVRLGRHRPRVLVTGGRRGRTG